MHKHKNKTSGMTRDCSDQNQQHTTSNQVFVVLHRHLCRLKDAFISSHSLKCLTVLPVRNSSYVLIIMLFTVTEGCDSLCYVLLTCKTAHSFPSWHSPLLPLSIIYPQRKALIQQDSFHTFAQLNHSEGVQVDKATILHGDMERSTWKETQS